MRSLWIKQRSIRAVTGLSIAAGLLYSSNSAKNKEEDTCEPARSAECRATVFDDCFCIHEAFGERQITDYVDALTPGEVYLFTAKGPSLKSHSRRNRLNAGPGETEGGGGALKRRWKKNRMLNASFSQLQLNIKGNIPKILLHVWCFSEDGGKQREVKWHPSPR